jgi:predicted nucleic acid-binding Zn ribbon protein
MPKYREGYNITCSHCGYADDLYHIQRDYASIICKKCKKTFDERDVLEQLGKAGHRAGCLKGY